MKGVHNLMHPLLVDNTLCCMESLNGRQISPLYAALGHHAVCKGSVVGTERIGFILDAYRPRPRCAAHASRQGQHALRCPEPQRKSCRLPETRPRRSR